MIETIHLTEDQFQQYKNRKIPITELLAIGDHLAQCKECREKLGGSEERAAILEALTRDLRSAIVNGTQDLTCKELEVYIDVPLDPPPVIPTSPQNRFGAILPFVIGIAAILLFFGLIAFCLTNLL